MIDGWRNALRNLTVGLAGRADASVEARIGAAFDRRVADALDLIDHGEPGVAFENLAQNVYDFDVVLRAEEYAAFDEIGRVLRLDPESWSFLEALVE